MKTFLYVSASSSASFADRCPYAAVRSISFTASSTCQRRQPEEVHLQQAELFERLHVVRGYDFLVLGEMHRHQVRERLRTKSPRRRHDAGVAHQAFQFLGRCR